VLVLAGPPLATARAAAASAALETGRAVGGLFDGPGVETVGPETEAPDDSGRRLLEPPDPEEDVGLGDCEDGVEEAPDRPFAEPLDEDGPGGG
jgi:hypothetical protein